MHVADLIDDEKGVDKIAADSETFVRSERVCVGDQEFVTACDELCTLFITENFEVVDPGTGFGGCGFVVGVGCVFQGTHRMKIGKGELLHGRRGVREEMVRALGGEEGTGELDIDPSNRLIWTSARTYTFGIVWLKLLPLNDACEKQYQVI